MIFGEISDIEIDSPREKAKIDPFKNFLDDPAMEQENISEDFLLIQFTQNDQEEYFSSLANLQIWNPKGSGSSDKIDSEREELLRNCLYQANSNCQKTVFSKFGVVLDNANTSGKSNYEFLKENNRGMDCNTNYVRFPNSPILSGSKFEDLEIKERNSLSERVLNWFICDIVVKGKKKIGGNLKGVFECYLNYDRRRSMLKPVKLALLLRREVSLSNFDERLEEIGLSKKIYTDVVVPMLDCGKWMFNPLSNEYSFEKIIRKWCFTPEISVDQINFLLNSFTESNEWNNHSIRDAKGKRGFKDKRISGKLLNESYVFQVLQVYEEKINKLNSKLLESKWKKRKVNYRKFQNVLVLLEIIIKKIIYFFGIFKFVDELGILAVDNNILPSIKIGKKQSSTELRKTYEKWKQLNNCY